MVLLLSCNLERWQAHLIRVQLKKTSLDLRKRRLDAYCEAEGYTAMSKCFIMSRTDTVRVTARQHKTNSVANKLGHGYKCKFFKTLVRKIVRDISKGLKLSARVTVAKVDLFWTWCVIEVSCESIHRGGLWGHHPSKISIAETTPHQLPTKLTHKGLNMVKCFGSLCFGLMKLNLRFLGPLILLLFVKEGNIR